MDTFTMPPRRTYLQQLCDDRERERERERESGKSVLAARLDDDDDDDDDDEHLFSLSRIFIAALILLKKVLI